MSDGLDITISDRVALVTMNRPEVLNALSSTVLLNLLAALRTLDEDPRIGCIVLTGSSRAFAAGADIREMQAKSAGDMAAEDFFGGWGEFTRLRTPKIAAVSGYALGGGCELAMMCDIIYCSRSAKFGQPEIKLGVIPGMGGTQRLTRLIGRAKAMDMILTGRMMDADEAERAGLVARVFVDDALLPESLAAARTIASYSKPATMLAAEAVDRAEEVSLAEGVLFERRVFHSLFATEDRKEGMAAFLEKRPAVFVGR
ncbi:enoyl-CoA hydratase [Rhizobium sp. SG_E_25_P2]|uniref:enoyl-CoA hydratase-related protein n=1 Tax=Rhizobium sp. SG_E_25_P2 TaxID=2879942 RepID=UPI002475E8F9|nr:enoyl-CoA hydratase-related protein [Rhizobium sp. SG_E_25_P2]MDH6265154.1 enoyl-CoA hydratase [Rhizobium sp. SG_E_25_P2]